MNFGYRFSRTIGLNLIIIMGIITIILIPRDLQMVTQGSKMVQDY
ncbi:hypothetical protein [Litchfieldia alkalitelluris]|nr:hypothetical protein [Litchfieldia alkalitelluris]